MVSPSRGMVRENSETSRGGVCLIKQVDGNKCVFLRRKSERKCSIHVGLVFHMGNHAIDTFISAE